jgi:hypothetical protein
MQQYEIEIKLKDMFGLPPFIICINIEDMDNIINEENTISIKYTPCECNVNKNPIYYNITNEKITNKYIIQQLINSNFNLFNGGYSCRHIFLDGFCKVTNTKNEYEIIVGSIML